MTEQRRKLNLKWITRVFIVAVCLFGSACEKEYEAPVPDTAWPEFDSPGATSLKTSSRTFMEGVYRVTDGAEEFGNEVALKWSYVTSTTDTTYHLSMYCGKDIAYFICEGKQLGGSLIFNGYWRKMVNVETGIARFTISGENGADRLLNGSSQVGKDDIILEGTWGNGEELPANSLVLTYDRPLYQGQPFEILAHRAGGRTSDHLPAAENSIGIIRYASRLGATGIEIDVQLTSDGVPVLYHDDKLNLRLIQKNGLVGGIKDYSFQQINTFVRLIDGQSIPTLRDALNTVVFSTEIRFVWLDTKYVGPLEIVRELQKEYLKKAKDIGRDLQIVIGLPGEDQVNAFLALPDYQEAPALCELSLEDLQSTGAVVWGPRWTLGLQNDEVTQVHGEGRKAFVWTLDDPAFIDQFINQGDFDGILTNYPSAVAYYYYVKQ